MAFFFACRVTVVDANTLQESLYVALFCGLELGLLGLVYRALLEEKRKPTLSEIDH